jgi:hypothetical protein
MANGMAALRPAGGAVAKPVTIRNHPQPEPTLELSAPQEVRRGLKAVKSS